ncbi:MAG: xanthine dehydrogenase family protein [Candidatus Rokubacteria bacterium]|nr:xanthine dehydrogenase family protein [Candidatus Rokubacteria bacterium]
MTAPIGVSLKRKEDRRFLTGHGCYLDDLRLPGLLHAAIVRSPHAHARVERVDAAAAREMPGVVAVLTIDDLPECEGAVPPLVAAPALRAYRHGALAGASVRHAGEAVAVVVADDPYRAADGVEAVAVAYTVLPAAASVAAALAPNGPRVFADWPDNVVGPASGQVGDLERGFAEANVVIEGRFAYPRVGGMPIEPRGVLALPAAPDGTFTVWTSTQVPFAVRASVAAVLGKAEERVRVLAPDVGGGFGIKGHAYPEDVLIPAVARRLGRPVKWVETRREHFLAAAPDRDQEHVARLGVREDGTITALETAFTRDHGAYPTLGDVIALNTINHLPGPYRILHYRGVATNVVTHKTFTGAYRGAGRPEAAFVLDRLLDRAARRLGIDPAELRLRNLIRPGEMPYRTGLTYRDDAPIVYDPADYAAAFEQVLTRLGWDEWRTEQKRRRGGARPIGLGVSAYVEGTGIGPFEGADVRVDPSGAVYVLIGVSSQGQAHETTLAQICAAELGVDVERVVVRGGDTTLLPYGMGTIASRVAAVAGPAVARTSREVARKARLVAAELLECAPEDVVLEGGRAHVVGVRERGADLGRLARASLRSRALAREGGPGLHACAFFHPATVTWAFGAQACALEVDTDTGAVRLLRYAAVHDCGRPINPTVVEGQLHGGIVQGIGSALSEELIFDDGGQLLTGTLMEYGLPRADDVPPLDVVSLDHPSMLNELGIKGVGESGIISPAAVIAGAVEDALADGGVDITRVPLTPARVWEALRAVTGPASGSGAGRRP